MIDLTYLVEIIILARERHRFHLKFNIINKYNQLIEVKKLRPSNYNNFFCINHWEVIKFKIK
jgi:hypothetical protein